MRLIKTALGVLVAGIVFISYSTEWVKQNPLPLQYSLTPYHFLNYYGISAADSLRAYGFGSQYGDSALLYSEDGGKTWAARVIPGMAYSFCGARVFSCSTVVVAGHTLWQNTDIGAIFRTNDAGKDWKIIPLPVKDENPSFASTITNASFADSLNYFFVTGRYIDASWDYQHFLTATHDGGVSWSETLLPADLQQYGISVSDICFVDSCTGWFLTQNTLWSTGDCGTTWQQRLFTGYGPTRIRFLNRQNGWLIGQAVLHTADGGKTWTQQAPGVPSQNAIKFADPLNGWILLSDNRILHSRDGGKTWPFQYKITGYDGQINDVAFVNPACGWAIGNGGIVLHTTELPVPLIDSQFAYQNIFNVPFVFHYPGYLDSLSYDYTIHYGPQGMTISKGGTISWSPGTDSSFLQLVDLIVQGASGQKDSVSFVVAVNQDKRPFTGVKDNVKTLSYGKSGIAAVRNANGGIKFYVAKNATSAAIFDLRGCAVATIAASRSAQTGSEFSWDLRENSRGKAAMGTYIIRVLSNGSALAEKFTIAP